jgi:cation diffusion facilitator family transporter
MEKSLTETKEKRLVALSSVFAAILLTVFKLIVGILTGSLGILSEALHSGLDLVAAIMTFFAVKIADKPADEEHQYGHGKVENISALFETFLLLITCVWIIYEAVNRLTSGHTTIIVNSWSFIVIITAIVVDFTRSRALMKYAKKYNSSALEADALHFSTDILSSFVVLLGLFGASLGYNSIDTIAGLIVAVIVIFISYKLGKKSVDSLVDKSPANLKSTILLLAKQMPQIHNVYNIRSRESGSTILIDLIIEINSDLSVSEGHSIADRFETIITKEYPNSDINIHIEPFTK